MVSPSVKKWFADSIAYLRRNFHGELHLSPCPGEKTHTNCGISPPMGTEILHSGRKFRIIKILALLFLELPGKQQGQN